MPKINTFLQQGMTDVVPYDDSLMALSQVMPAKRMAG
jgi:flagellum-specific ATP synthase